PRAGRPPSRRAQGARSDGAPPGESQAGGSMRAWIAATMVLALFQVGSGQAAAQSDACAAMVFPGSAASGASVGGLCVSGDTLRLGDGAQVPFRVLPRGTSGVLPVMNCSMAE